MKKPIKFCISLILSLVIISNVRADNLKILILLSQYYGANYYFLHDNAEKYGWDMTLTAVTPTVGPCTSYASGLGCPTITVDLTISEIDDITEYDILAISSASTYVGVPPHQDILNSPEALALVASAVDEGLVVCAYCTGVRVLAAADVLNGVNVTGNPNYITEYITAGANWLGPQLPPVIDGNIVTSSRGMYYHIQITEAIATVLETLQSTDKNKGGEK